jgi:hypothetical protein
MTENINFVSNILGNTKMLNLCTKIGKEKGIRFSDIFHEDTEWESTSFGSKKVVISRSVNEIVYTAALEHIQMEKENTQNKLRKHLNNPHKIAEAIYTINKECKRMRDIASEAYYDSRHSAAGAASYQKNSLYAIKSEALNCLIEREELTSVGYHTFQDGKKRDLYVFGDFSFHVDSCQSSNDLGELNNISSDKLRSMSLDNAKILLDMYISL